jgi:hypothetical protein
MMRKAFGAGHAEQEALRQRQQADGHAAHAQAGPEPAQRRPVPGDEGDAGERQQEARRAVEHAQVAHVEDQAAQRNQEIAGKPGDDPGQRAAVPAQHRQRGVLARPERSRYHDEQRQRHAEMRRQRHCRQQENQDRRKLHAAVGNARRHGFHPVV